MRTSSAVNRQYVGTRTDVTTSTAPIYDAFLSYSVALDGRLAPALQRGIERYAKPWYRLRACRVFRDSTNLAAAPDLWRRIEAALNGSHHLLLLASPDAARSKWVRKEVEHWLATHDASSIVIVLTGGEIIWDDVTRDFDWQSTTALSPSLARVFHQEPLFVDLRWAREFDVDLSLANPHFTQAVLSLASRIRGLPMDELGGEAVRQFRTTRRLATGAVMTIAGLAIAASVGAWIASSEAERANERSAEVLRRESLRLAFASRGETASGNASDGISLALAALPTRFDVRTGRLPWATARGPDRPVAPEATGALVEALSVQRELRAYGPAPGERDGRFMESGFLDEGSRLFGFTRSGRLVVWSTETGAILVDLQSPAVMPKFFSLDRIGANAIVVDDDGTITFWKPSPTGTVKRLPVTSPNREGWQDRIHVMWSPEASRLLIGPPGEAVALYDIPSGRLIATIPHNGQDILTIATTEENGSVSVRLSIGGKVEKYAALDGARLDYSEDSDGGADHVLKSRDGRLLVTWGMLGMGGATVKVRQPEGNYETGGVVELAPKDQLLLSSNGRWFAKVHPDGTVQLANPLSRAREAWVSAGSPISSIEFDGSGRFLLARLDSGALSLFAADVHGWVDGFISTPGPGYSGLVTGDGKSVIMGTLVVERSALKGAIVTWDRTNGEVLRRVVTGSWPRVLRLNDGGDALASVLIDGTMHVWFRGASAPSWDARAGFASERDFVDVAFAGNIGRVFAATRAGSLVEFDLETGHEHNDVFLGPGEVTSIAISPDAKTLVATFADGPAIIGELNRLQPTRVTLGGTEGGARRSATTDKIVAVASADSVRAFDRSTGYQIGSWAVPGETLNSLAFNGDGSRLVAAADSGTAYVWDLLNPLGDIVLRTGSVSIYSATFTPDDAAVITTGHDGRARIWRTGKSVETLIKTGRVRAIRCIDEQRALRYAVSTLAENSSDATCSQVTNQHPHELD